MICASRNASCVPVPHCAQAYSGVKNRQGRGLVPVLLRRDCRPSTNSLTAAKDCTVLIHEATFSDGLRDDAIKKRHSTISEALGVGQGREARAGRS